MRGGKRQRALRRVDLHDRGGAGELGGEAQHAGVREQVEHARARERRATVRSMYYI
jgi:hypothetical protein